MANNTLSVSTLDYAGLQSSLANFLKNYPQFKDYAFEGSNLRTLIDLMAYNTYINNFYTNMALNEMFIDTAVLRDSVVSHAKDLNYIPRSGRSAVAYIDIQMFPPDLPAYISMPAGQQFVASNGNNIFTFVTTTNMTIPSYNDTYIITDVPIYEGLPVTESYLVDSSIQNQKFVISNPNIDTTSLVVTVTNELGVAEEWKFHETLFDLTSISKAYFLQASADKYEILFGDNITGLKPMNGSVVTIRYRVCNFDQPNGVSRFKAIGAIGGYFESQITATRYANGEIIVASGGQLPESTESIRLKAPRAYQTLERAITAEDYKNILFSEFPDIRDIIVYGGEELTPPEYGKVYIAVDLSSEIGLSQLQADEFVSFLQPRIPLTFTPVIQSANYTLVGFSAYIQYNQNKSALSPTDIEAKVLSAVQKYETDNLNIFNTRFRLSQLLAAIDNSDSSIVDNQVNIQLIKQFIPELGLGYSNFFDYQTRIVESSLFSTEFTYDGQQCYFRDDGAGNVNMVSIENIVLIKNVGTIDYQLGQINLINIVFDDLVGNYVELYVKPYYSDFQSVKDMIIRFSFDNIDISATGIRL